MASTLMAAVSAPLHHGGKATEEALQQLQKANETADAARKKDLDQTERAQQTTDTTATKKRDEGVESKQKRPGLPIHSFNHLSKETENVEEMVKFYTKVMGFRRIKRPPFPFAGAWLFMPPTTSLHIIEKDPNVDLPEGPCTAIKKMENWQEIAKNPASIKRGALLFLAPICVVLFVSLLFSLFYFLPCFSFCLTAGASRAVGHHMAFRTEDLELTIQLLKEYGIKFAENVVPLTGQRQLFFFDPDGNGIEICDCDVDPPPFDDEFEDQGDVGAPNSQTGQNDGRRSPLETSPAYPK
jgi:catechol 2,3-dioxygenase-like lactoylglutathione lyase family enzyme